MHAGLENLGRPDKLWSLHLIHCIHAATKRMIRGHFMASGSDYVELIWTRPKFLPEKYQVTYTCTVMTRFTPNDDKKNRITSNTQYLSSGTTSFRISDLCPRSICTLILLAVYNRASIDSGITITGTTENEGTSKKTLVWMIPYWHLVIFTFITSP